MEEYQTLTIEKPGAEMTQTELTIVFVIIAAATFMNIYHCVILGRRIDNVHKRLDLTLEDNNLHDFWNESDSD